MVIPKAKSENDKIKKAIPDLIRDGLIVIFGLI